MSVHYKPPNHRQTAILPFHYCNNYFVRSSLTSFLKLHRTKTELSQRKYAPAVSQGIIYKNSGKPCLVKPIMPVKCDNLTKTANTTGVSEKKELVSAVESTRARTTSVSAKAITAGLHRSCLINTKGSPFIVALIQGLHCCLCLLGGYHLNKCESFLLNNLDTFNIPVCSEESPEVCFID